MVCGFCLIINRENPFHKEESTFPAVYFYIFKTNKIKSESKAESWLTIVSECRNAF